MSTIQDTFTRSNSSTTINPPSDGVGSWSVLTSSAVFGVTSNQGYCPTPNSFSAVARDTGVTDHDVQVTVNATGTGCGPIARAADDSNYLWLRATGSGHTLFEKSGGSFTSLGSDATAWASGDVLKISVSGSSVTCYRNGTALSSIGTVSTSLSAGTKAGVVTNDSTALFDVWSATFTASGTAYTLTAAAGSFAETGNAAGLARGRRLSAAAGSFAETGVAAGLRAARKVAAATGSFAETGNAAGLSLGHRLTASAGSFAETGNTAGMFTSHRLTAAAGAFSETGNAAGLALGHRLTAAAGAFAETGSAAGLSLGHRLTASAGSFSETGSAAGLSLGHRLTAAAGSFSETGSAATLTHGTAGAFTLTAAAGSFALAGNAAGMPLGHRLTASAGAFAETGSAAGLSLGHRLTASAGSFSETGSAATLTYGHAGSFTLTAAAGSFVLAGKAAALSRGPLATNAPIRSAIVAALKADAGLALVFGSRVYPLSVPGSAAFPALTYQLISGPRTRTLDGADGTVKARIQFGVVSRNYADCESGAEALRQFLDQDVPPVLAGVTVSESALLNETDHAEPPSDGSDRWIYRTVCEYAILYYEPVATG